MTVFHHHAAHTVQREAAAALDALCVSHHPAPILLLFSGGSTFSLLNALRYNGEGGSLTVGVLDERYSHDPAVNNFAQLAATSWYARAKQHECTAIDTRVRDGETLGALTARMQTGLRAWKERNPSGTIIITQGMGADGHTAGIMPFPEAPLQFDALFCATDWVVGYDVAEKNPYRLRVTSTITFLRDVVDHTIIFIVGEEKEAAWSRCMAEEGTLAETPIRIVRTMRDVRIFTNLKS